MRKSLNHYNEINACQFITFRTRESIDSYLLKLNQMQFEDEARRQYEADLHLDSSEKGSYLNNDIIELTLEYLKSMEPDFFKLHAVSVMPNHIHILITQFQNIDKIMHQMKGALSNLINKKLDKTGSLWSRSYFDKAIRNQKHFDLTYNYIKYNAVKANLPDSQRRFYGVYE